MDERARWGWGLLIVFVVILLYAAAHPASRGPSATVTYWRAGSSQVSGNVAAGDSGCTNMHVQLKLSDKNYAVQHTYDLWVKNLDAHTTRPWSTTISGIMPEPVTVDIVDVSASPDCMDQH